MTITIMPKKKEEDKKERTEAKEKILQSIKSADFRNNRTFGQKAADGLTKWAGSWAFILTLFAFIIIWMGINGYLLIQYHLGKPFDPYPFILLNLVLSCLAAVQAPIILMSQNRTSQRDRLKAEFDYRINKRAEEEIREIKNLLIKRNKKK
ncbi:DUF1003 domain-containing protein [Candidatus Pacearchaeota archaeon]|nr:DUF1003 domain-containing protein [Candidatus Pacearchaeota archaeon]